MKKIGIFYGSSSGNTEFLAKKIASGLNVSMENVFDISKVSIEKTADYDCLLLGSSTWGLGEIQDDWDISKLEKCNLSGKQVAVFGTGDSSSYADTFCDAMAVLAETSQKAGAELIGNNVDVSDYSFDSSLSVVNGCFCGLPIDEDNESNKTDERVNSWVSELRNRLGV